MATGLARDYTPVVIRVKPIRVVSYDYTKPGFIQPLIASVE